MKKIFTLLVALTTVFCGLNAEVLLKDSFNWNVGNLTLKDMLNAKVDQVDNNEWFYTTGTAAKIQVVDTALTFKDYCTNKSAKAIQFKGNTNKAVRGITVPDKTTSIYYSVLMNVHELKDPGKSSPSKDGIIMLHNVNSSAVGNCWAQLRYLNDYSAGTYSLGISKANEAGVRWVTGFPKDSTILVVVRYDIIEGDTNDVVYMWINPTKLDESKPTSWCVQDTASSTGNPYGAKTKADAGTINRIFLKPAAHTPNMHLDEIRVATKWADLFEGGGTEPAISVPGTLDFGGVFQGETSSKKLTITGSNLKSGVTISKTSSEINLSATSFTKTEAEAGAELTVTLNAKTAGASVDTIVITSDTIVKKVVVGWTTYPVIEVANVAALKAVTEQDGNYRFTGEVIVTRDTTLITREIFIQDATGAAKIKDGYSTWAADNLVGSKITNFIVSPFDTISSLVSFDPLTKPTVVSTGNKVTPVEVTLAELQANGEDYLLEVVKIKKVYFVDAGGTFAGDTQYEFTQATETANVKVEKTRGITGCEIPEVANVIGFSWNVGGSVIVPRSISDIEDATLLKNGSFEKWKVSSGGVLGTSTDFEGWDVSKITFGAKVVDSTCVLDGKYAFKTTSSLSQPEAYLYQEINCIDYAQNDEFKVRIGYKNLNDSVIQLACYWETSMGSTEEMKQGAVKQVLPSSKSDYNVVEVNTSKPEGARYFVFKVMIPKKAEVLIDNCAFTYQEISTKINETVSTVEMKARKIVRNGQLLIVRDGAIYSITGQKL